jgi:murein DD-endopeptidase MepM/ murein hydrolase activator NlpD
MKGELKKMNGKLTVLDKTLDNLQYRDDEIYKSIFNASPPDFYNSDSSSIYGRADTASVRDLADLSARITVRAMADSRCILDASSAARRAFLDMGKSVRNIPSIVPLKDFTEEQAGASVGDKINPFYKTVVRHDGLDILGVEGADIIAPADGVVKRAGRKDFKDGNVLVIDHMNGYETTYKHLGAVLISRGAKVRQGMVIARIGQSGLSFAPHLHYEIRHNGKIVNPINYFFAQFGPSGFKNIMIYTENTGQSLD